MTSPQNSALSLTGWISKEYIPFKGKKLGPYYVRRWKQNGKLHREYIKAADLEKVKAACENHRQKRIAERQCSKELSTITGNLTYLLKMVKRSIKGLLRPEDQDHLAILESKGPTTPGRPPLRLQRSTPLLGGFKQPPVHKNEPTRDFMVPSVTKNFTATNLQSPNPNDEPATGIQATQQAPEPLFAAMLARLPSSNKTQQAALKDLDLSQATRKRKHVYCRDRIPHPWVEKKPLEKPFYYHIRRRLSTEDPNLIIEFRDQATDRRNSIPPPGWRPNPNAENPWDY